MSTSESGSNWRKWDLHLHTPDSNLEGHFSSWDEYLRLLQESDISAFGVTNYFCFKDGEIEKVSNHLKQFDKRVFPNLEFRIEQPNKKSQYINIHVLFSDSFVKNIDKIKTALGKLELVNTSSEGKALYCDFDTVMSIGCKNVLVNLEKLVKVLNANFTPKKDFLIVGCPSGYGGHRPAPGEGRGHTLATEIDKYCHVFFGNTGVTDFFLKEDRYPGAIAKPVFDCSDSHNDKEIGQKYSWIKADCTFIGLTQTLYEPRDRVRLQEQIPDNRNEYQIIDKVKFSTNIAELLPNKYIYLNQNLNTIIGGKSSGKSMLLYYIAKTIDESQVHDKINDLGQAHYDFDKTPGFDFEVHWRDGMVTKLKDEATTGRLVTYIPQLYINHIAETKNSDSLKEIIESFLKQNSEYDSFSEKTITDISQTKTKLKDSINKYFEIVSKLVQAEKDLRSKGDKAALIASVASIDAKINLLRVSSNFTEEEELEYIFLNKRQLVHDNRGKTISQTLDVLIQHHTFIGSRRENELIEIDSFPTDLADSSRYTSLLVGRIKEYEKEKAVEYYKELSDFNLVVIERVKKVEEKNNELKKSVLDRLKLFVDKIKDKTRLDELNKSRISEEYKIVEIEKLEKKVEELNKDIEYEKRNIKGFYRSVHQLYISIVNEINTKYSIISTEKQISLKSKVTFDKVKFHETFSRQITKNSYLKNIFEGYFDDDNNYVYNELSHVDAILGIFDKVNRTNSNVRFNQSWSAETASNALLEDNFRIDFKLSQNNEDILRMSPGKKGLILLILILHLNNSKYPILIDQPEDNLDNRTIYSELKDYIKEKKLERQIIIVTHNSNLVVTTDAENVIVANRQGEEVDNKNENTVFEYVNGALEKSFVDSRKNGVLNKIGIKEHVCEILEGGERAFLERENKYNIKRVFL